MLHLFRDCPKVSSLWQTIGGPPTFRRTFTLDWDAWIAANILQTNCKHLGYLWAHLFIFTCWFIWKWRNNFIFDENFDGPHNPFSTILQYLNEWTSATVTLKNNVNLQVCYLSWNKPPAGFFKLNVDGSRSSNGLIGAGGVIRDCNGIWCNGFMHNIGSGEVLLAEAWGLATGLKLAVACNISHLLVESDSVILINLLQSSCLDLHPLGTLLLNCKNIMNLFSSCSVKHIHRERNIVADCLAKRSLNQDIGSCVLPSMPTFAAIPILDDINGLVHPRSISAAFAAS